MSRNTLYSLFPFIFSLIFTSASLFAEEAEDLTALAGDLLKTSFQIREHTKTILDGSNEASGILRTSQILNELIYSSPQKWRVRRDLPFTEQTFEFLMNDKGVRFMNAFNRSVEPPFPVPAKTYLEVLLSPLRLAQVWSLADGKTSVSDLIEKLKKESLKNAEGDQIALESKSDGSLLIKMNGKILHDGKTKVGIESVWQLSNQNKITDADLANSLMRSL